MSRFISMVSFLGEFSAFNEFLGIFQKCMGKKF